MLRVKQKIRIDSVLGPHVRDKVVYLIRRQPPSERRHETSALSDDLAHVAGSGTWLAIKVPGEKEQDAPGPAAEHDTGGSSFERAPRRFQAMADGIQRKGR
jgi:hypothetical protein